MSMGVPEKTDAILHEERKTSWFQKIMVVAVVAILGFSVVNLIQRASDSAKQSTTQKAATRSLSSAERADCRSEYNSIRQSVIEDAQAAQRESSATILGYLLSLKATEDVQASLTKLQADNDRVDGLKPLPDMVDNGFEVKGKTYPPCPVVK